MAFDSPFYVFTPQQIPLSKISDDVFACDLWFGPTPIKNPAFYPMTQQRDQGAG